MLGFNTYKKIAIFILIVFILITIQLCLKISGGQNGQTANNPVLLVYLLINGFLFIVLFIISYKVIISFQKKEVMDSLSKIITNDVTDRDEQKKEYKEIGEDNGKVIRRITSGLKDISSVNEYTEILLKNIAREYKIVQGMFFLRGFNSGNKYLMNKNYMKDDTFGMVGSYAWSSEEKPVEFKTGEGLHGQVAKDMKLKNIYDIPEDYIQVSSGLGNSPPKNIVIFPVKYNNDAVGVVELASFERMNSNSEQVFLELSELIGDDIVGLLDG